VKERVSLNIRLFLVTMCIAVPVIAALFFTGIRERTSAKKERINELHADVEVEMSRIDTQLKFLRNSLANLVMDNAEFKHIADEDEEDNDFWLANQTVLEKINNQTAELDPGFTVFVYYPENGVFYNYKKDIGVSEFVRQQINEQAELSAYRQWSTIWCAGQPYLFFLLDYNNYYIGAWSSYENLLQGLQQNTDKTGEAGILQEKYLICDENGQVMVPAEDKDTWLSFGRNMYTDEEKNSWYYAGAISELSDFYLVKQISKTTLEELPAIGSEITVFAAVILLLFVVYGVCLYLWILTPMAYLKKSMEIIQQGELDYRIPELDNCSVEFDAVIQEFNYLMDHIKNLKIQMYEERLAGKETELQYLSRQIQPHFILNTLNTIYNYSESDVKTTKQLIRLTSGYYRYVVNVNSRYVQLGQELEHIQDYMRLQKMRYPNAFNYKVTCEETIKIVPIPPFIIESFVGNAIKHGLKPGKMTEIQVNVSKLEEFRILIQVKDNGTGFSDDSLDAVEEFLEKGIVSEELGVGICNSVARLRLIYGDKCEIRIYNQEPSGAVVDITLNLQKTKAV
jgi:two-component system sensor histidine kinase YesM